jgi:hypothetical protein
VGGGYAGLESHFTVLVIRFLGFADDGETITDKAILIVQVSVVQPGSARRLQGRSWLPAIEWSASFAEASGDPDPGFEIRGEPPVCLSELSLSKETK